MKQKTVILSSLATLGFLLGINSGNTIATMSHEEMKTTETVSEFEFIEQPLWVKGAVTVGGLGLIGLELWWFLGSKPRARETTTKD